jgi:hypothetical protein
VGEFWARMDVLKKTAEINIEESFHDDSACRTLVEMCFAFCVCFARAAHSRLSGVNFMENGPYREALVNALGDELLAGKTEFLDSTVLCFPIHCVESCFIPSVVFLKMAECCWRSRGLA